MTLLSLYMPLRREGTRGAVLFSATEPGLILSSVDSLVDSYLFLVDEALSLSASVVLRPASFSLPSLEAAGLEGGCLLLHSLF